MERDYMPKKSSLSVRNILDGLPRHRLGQEPDEVAGMAGFQGDADLTLRLEATNAWPVAGARIHDNEGTPSFVDLDALRWYDAYKRVVHGAWQLPAIHKQLAAECQHMRCGLGSVLVIALTALS
jgi:hypothetical protein